MGVRVLGPVGQLRDALESSLRAAGFAISTPGDDASRFAVEVDRSSARGRATATADWTDDTGPAFGRRELQVLQRFVTDIPAARIARELGISRHTVDTYLKRIRRKYDDVGRPARTRAAMLVRALEDGLIAIPEKLSS